jgi:hypothetical protein
MAERGGLALVVLPQAASLRLELPDFLLWQYGGENEARGDGHIEEVGLGRCTCCPHTGDQPRPGADRFPAVVGRGGGE